MKFKTKTLLAASVSTFAMFFSVVAVSNQGGLTTKAEGCSHEGYIWEAPVTYSANREDEIGHTHYFACCDCHDVFSDAELTHKIGNSINDRSKIDYGYEYFYKSWDVNKKFTPSYDETKEAFVHVDENFSIKAATETSADPYSFVELANVAAKNVTYEFEIYNGTDHDVIVTAMTTKWKQLFETDIAVGEWATIKPTWSASLGFSFMFKEASKEYTEGTVKFVVKSEVKADIYKSTGVSSSLNDWGTYPTTVDETYGEVAVCDFSTATSNFTAAMNFNTYCEKGTYAKTYFYVYNPTANTVSNVSIRSAGYSDYRTLEQGPKVNLEPGWNKIDLSPSLFEYSDLKCVYIAFSDYANSAATGWKISHINAWYPTSVTRFSTYAINSDLANWHAYSTREYDETYNNCTVADLTDAAEWSGAKFSLVWNSVSAIEVDKYERVYFAFYNPTEFTFTNLKINAADSAWSTLQTTNAFSLVPGWNEVYLPVEMFEYETLNFISLPCFSADNPFSNWASAGWKISNFFGVAVDL